MAEGKYDQHIMYNVWWRTNKSPGDPPSLHEYWWWRNLKFSRLTREELVSTVRGEEITHLMFDNHPTNPHCNGDTLVPADLPEEIKVSLKHLIIRGVDETQQFGNVISCLSNMGSLELLCLYQMDLSSISDEMRGILMGLKLKRLTLSECSVTADTLTSISLMTSLEKLNLTDNNLSTDSRLSDTLSTLISLKVLDLIGCGLTEIPKSISLMTSLEELYLSHNILSTDSTLSDKLSTLISMKVLDLRSCYLTEIPQSISLMTSLEKLDWSGNNLSRDSTLSHKLSTLTSLKRLNLWNCDITEIPQSLQGMRGLEELNVMGNKIELIPEWIRSLTSLSTVNLSRNETLKKLHMSIRSLPITKLDLSECGNLVEPPQYVCDGGLENIRQYYTDLESGSHSMTLATVAVIGKRMAGKTSLVKSLEAKEIVLTCRRDNPQSSLQSNSKSSDETTRVFNFIELWLKSSNANKKEKVVNVVDFGGDDVYHHAYQLTFRNDCVPIVVVNILHYEDESRLWGRREATRRVLFDWIAHLYLACPQLERPVLVITHKDKAKCFPKLKTTLMATINDLHQDLLLDTSLDERIAILKNKEGGGFFLASEIIEVEHVEHGASYATVFGKLENILYQRAEKSEVTIPQSWKAMIDGIKGRQQSHVNVNELLASLSVESVKQHKVILDFMRRSGAILWYKQPEAQKSFSSLFNLRHYTRQNELDDIIFHDVSKVTEIIKTLFSHSSADERRVLQRDELDKLWQEHSTEGSSRLPTDIAIQLLTKFNLIYGPTTVNHNSDCYLIPYFMKKHQFRPSTADIKLQTEVVFVGLSVPVYSYQQMTISYLKLLHEEDFDAHAFGNGASGRHVRETTAAVGEKSQHVRESQLIHDPENQKVVIRVQGDVVCAGQCWELFLKIVRKLSATVKTAWQAACIRYDIICPHCLLLDELNPEKRSNPDFLMKAISSESSGRHDGRSRRIEVEYREDCRCRTVKGVPSPLRYPCGELSDEDMQSLVTYIRNVRPDEQQEITRLVGEIENNGYDMAPYPQTDFYPPPTTDRIYQMTRTRVRALVINNRHGDITPGGGGRSGSDKDYTNMTKMLKSFGFVISHFSRDGDWTSHEIVEAVHNETELVYQGTTSVHEGLGMFALVMMSHGDVGTISGFNCEEAHGQQTSKHVSLVDIYKLLSSQYFPAMMGKPKLVILQACSGVRAVRQRRASQVGRAGPPRYSQPGEPIGPQCSTQSHAETNTDDSYQTIDDLLVMKPSFDEHVSYRHTTRGSFYIGALIATFCRYSGEKDVRTLCDLIQEAVRNEVRGQGVEQVPVTISTFTNGRKLYLSPGVNMRTTNHPDSFTSEELPPPNRQRISLHWRADEEAPVTNYPSEKKKIVRFDVVRNT